MDRHRGIALAVLLAEDDADDNDERVRVYDSDSDEEGMDRHINDALSLKWARLGDPTFKRHFRMDKITFELLTVAVGQHMAATGRLQRRGLAISRALQMTIWIMATPDSFRSVGEQFGVKDGSIHNQYKTIIQVLTEMRGKYMKWPDYHGASRIARSFEARYGYPGVMGCIDGCNISCTAPLEQAQRYVNRHDEYSVTLQGVCDDRMLFLDVNLGQPGAVGDIATLKASPLCNRMLRQRNFMDNDYHLLGDGIYPCTDQLLTPYRDYGNLTERQGNHNFILSRCRATIERAFALLKGKWRRLKYFPHKSLEYMLDTIMACVVLHNFIILQGEPFEVEEIQPVFDNVDVNTDVLLQQRQGQGEQRREYIATMLYHYEDV